MGSRNASYTTTSINGIGVFRRHIRSCFNNLKIGTGVEEGFSVGVGEEAADLVALLVLVGVGNSVVVGKT
jgi:hypothetical protein